MRILITGGAGFIGSAVVRQYLTQTDHRVLNVDKLTYAGNLDSLLSVSSRPNYSFKRADINDRRAMDGLFAEFKPDAVMHLAAESHVDRSIDGPGEFVQTNIVGTYTLLETARKYWTALDAKGKQQFRMHHISTDEVFGSLGATGLFTETTPYQPNSPYSASKAASDHLVRAWFHTFGLPLVTTNCSNNYGACQFPEKLMPLMIINALGGKPLPVYGKGENVRDWLYVEDHAEALRLVLDKGRPGETYNIGGSEERKNLDVVQQICKILDEEVPNSKFKPHANLIKFVTDRPGHDLRYAIDSGKIRRELGWKPQHTFESGLRETVKWYLSNRNWWEKILAAKYQGERLGLATEVKG